MHNSPIDHAELISALIIFALFVGPFALDYLLAFLLDHDLPNE